MENTREYFALHREEYWENLERKCYNCGSTTNDLELHHIIPLLLGGTNLPTNIVPLCEQCHGLVHGMQGRKGHSEATKRGLETARLNGKQIGRAEGAKVTTKKSITAKEQIMKYSKDFQGSLADTDVIKLIGINRNTYYKYKRELKEN